jgi:hypothetical protein
MGWCSISSLKFLINKFLGIRSMKTWWQLYKELELIPDAVPEPQTNFLFLTAPLKRLWRSLLNSLSKKPVDENPIELLERCLMLEMAEPRPAGISEPWHQLRSFLNGVWFEDTSPGWQEPKIWQSLGRDGNLWWHVYDPQTGRTADLESEEEVRIWLEGRLH